MSNEQSALIASPAVHTRTTVAIAMSGGVDSSVASELLIEHGFGVFGLTMQLWTAEKGEKM